MRTLHLDHARMREFEYSRLVDVQRWSAVPPGTPLFVLSDLSLVRVTAEIMESNGSTSMASICAGTLALMDE